MHVLVTGATGLIGSVVVARLLVEGHRVTGLARSERKGSSLGWSGGGGTSRI
jgi:uncharacterized protein YbjT (DUF2867 family)